MDYKPVFLSFNLSFMPIISGHKKPLHRAGVASRVLIHPTVLLIGNILQSLFYRLFREHSVNLNKNNEKFNLLTKAEQSGITDKPVGKILHSDVSIVIL